MREGEFNRWLPFVVAPSDPAAGRPKPAFLKLRVVADASEWEAAVLAHTGEPAQLWPVDVIITEFAVRAIAWYRQAAEIKVKRTAATADELRQWVTSTLALADRLPFLGEPTADAMRSAATQLTRSLDSTQLCFNHWPSFGTTADAEKKVSLHLWAIDQVVRHANAVEATYGQLWGEAFVTIPKTAIWPALFSTDPAPPFADYYEAMSRVRKLEKTMLEPMRDALMVGLLADVITHGQLGPDGHPRTSDTPTPPKSS